MKRDDADGPATVLAPSAVSTEDHVTFSIAVDVLTGRLNIENHAEGSDPNQVFACSRDDLGRAGLVRLHIRGRGSHSNLVSGVEPPNVGAIAHAPRDTRCIFLDWIHRYWREGAPRPGGTSRRKDKGPEKEPP